MRNPATLTFNDFSPHMAETMPEPFYTSKGLKFALFITFHQQTTTYKKTKKT